MKLMTKGKGELHKRLLNKACNKPKIAGGRRREEEEGRGVVLHEAPDGPCELHYKKRAIEDVWHQPAAHIPHLPGEGFPSSLSQGHHLANSARGLMFNNLGTSMAL